jgi:hypothetical protein
VADVTMGDMTIQLMRVPGEYAVHRLAPDAAVPEAAWASPFVSVSRSSEELSIITGAGIRIDAQSTVGPWLAYRVAGTIDFSATGVMSALTAPLADAGLGILGVSTYDTDYILVHADAGEAAEITWRAAGIDVG